MSISLWLDYWLPYGRQFYDLLLLRVLSSIGLTWNAKALDIILNGVWAFPIGHQDLQPLWNSIHFYPYIDISNHYVWKGDLLGRFTIDIVWEVLRDFKPTDSMDHLFQFPSHILRYSFILWLAFLGRLHTINKLHACQIITFSVCIFVGRMLRHTTICFFNVLSPLCFKRIK